MSWNTQDASAAGMREPWMGWETLRSKRCQVCGKCTLIDLNGLYNSQTWQVGPPAGALLWAGLEKAGQFLGSVEEKMKK